MRIWDREHQNGQQNGEEKMSIRRPPWNHNNGEGRRNMEDSMALIIRRIKEATP